MKASSNPVSLLIEAPDSKPREGLLQFLSWRFTRPVVRLRSSQEGEQEGELRYRSLGDQEPFEQLATFARGDIYVFLSGFPRDFKVPRNWLLALGSLRTKCIDRVEGESFPELVPHRPYHGVAAQILTVFPGVIIPITMGSHQRIFQLIGSMSEAGLPSDLLVMANRDEIERAKPILYQLAPRIHSYRNSKRKLPPKMLFRRWLEKYWRRCMGIKSQAPELFEELLERKATFSGCKALRRLVDSRRYRTVMVNYAWMEKIRQMIPMNRQKEIEWICDTHDVQFVRGETENVNERRLGVTREKEKETELGVLRSFDHVLALSKSDAEILEKELGQEHLTLTPTGFDYTWLEPKTVELDAPVFGFIGSGMRANVMALEIIVREWWPRILEKWPGARLCVAGRVTQSAKGLLRKPREWNISVDGLVDILTGWYRKIDIILSPVVVQGGLNFKSVEALMAGKLLITNSMGVKCLGDDALAEVANSADELMNILDVELSDPLEFQAKREKTQRRARELFGDDNAYRSLHRLLRDSITTTPPPVENKPLRILIQCGDSFENRGRILPLARAIRDRGHHPVVMVYSREYIAPFLAKGVDAVALYDFNETPLQRDERRKSLKKITNLGRPYKGFDLDDLADIAQMQRPDRFVTPRLGAAIDHISRDLDRVLRLIEHVQPDELFVWNGHTGYTANALRQYARNNGMRPFYMERSICPDGVYVDPNGVNGNGELAISSAETVAAWDVAPPARPPENVLLPVEPEAVEALRNSGPWRYAKRIIFVPLQVQSDTNILYYSPEVKMMSDFLRMVHRNYYSPDSIIIVRPHPEEIVKNLALPNLSGVFVDSSGALEAWLEMADLVITINSTVGMEAILRGRPVVTLGYSIYSGKGLDTGTVPDPDRVASFWNVLINRYTALPESPLPKCVEDRLAPLAPGAIRPKNPLENDPSQLEPIAKQHFDAIRLLAMEQRQLSLVVENMWKTDKLNLTYRKDKVTFTPEWLIDRVRKELALSEEVSISIFKEELEPKKETEGNSEANANGEMERKAEVGLNGEEKTEQNGEEAAPPVMHIVAGERTTKKGVLFDRYLWPILK